VQTPPLHQTANAAAAIAAATSMGPVTSTPAALEAAVSGRFAASEMLRVTLSSTNRGSVVLVELVVALTSMLFAAKSVAVALVSAVDNSRMRAERSMGLVREPGSLGGGEGLGDISLVERLLWASKAQSSGGNYVLAGALQPTP